MWLENIFETAVGIAFDATCSMLFVESPAAAVGVMQLPRL
jgi:hypothetical protein